MAAIPEIRRVDPELNKVLLKDFAGERTGFVQVGPEKWFFPIKFETAVDDLLNFEVRQDDTWIVSYPRTGTTLTSEMMWLILNDIDVDTAKKIPLPVRFSFLEANIIMHKDVLDELRSENNDEGRKFIDMINIPSWVTLKIAPSPRYIKTHLPFQLLPKNLLTSGAKVIYVARNPKDVAVSYYYLLKLFRNQSYLGSFEKFWDYFENDLVIWSPFWNHVIEGWNNRHNPNVKFLFYEEFIKSPSDYVLKVATFLNRKLTETQVNKIVHHLKFDDFKNNTAVNFEDIFKIHGTTTENRTFIRKGKVGGWVEEFTPELSARADKWIEGNLKKTDLRFPL